MIRFCTLPRLLRATATTALLTLGGCVAYSPGYGYAPAPAVYAAPPVYYAPAPVGVVVGGGWGWGWRRWR